MVKRFGEILKMQIPESPFVLPSESNTLEISENLSWSYFQHGSHRIIRTKNKDIDDICWMNYFMTLDLWRFKGTPPMPPPQEIRSFLWIINHHHPLISPY